MSQDLVVQNWELLKSQAEIFFKSQILPPSIKNPLQALVIIQYGAELGYGPMQSLNAIELVLGRITLKAQTMRARIFKQYPNCIFKYARMDNEVCEIHAARDRADEVMKFTYTINDAKLAGLVKPGSGWQKNPADMLIARCSSRVARAMFPDCLLGLSYTPEEALDIETEKLAADDGDKVYDSLSHEDKAWLIEKGKLLEIPLASLKEISVTSHGKTYSEILDVLTKIKLGKDNGTSTENK